MVEEYRLVKERTQMKEERLKVNGCEMKVEG